MKILVGFFSSISISQVKTLKMSRLRCFSHILACFLKEYFRKAARLAFECLFKTQPWWREKFLWARFGDPRANEFLYKVSYTLMGISNSIDSINLFIDISLELCTAIAVQAETMEPPKQRHLVTLSFDVIAKKYEAWN